jgi:hypothetical protein
MQWSSAVGNAFNMFGHVLRAELSIAVQLGDFVSFPIHSFGTTALASSAAKSPIVMLTLRK